MHYSITPVETKSKSMRGLVTETWRRSFEKSSGFQGLPTSAYLAYMNSLMGKFVGYDDKAIDLASPDFLLIARDLERPNLVYGWGLFSDLKPGLALHYLYVKRPDRHQGIASHVLAQALIQTDPGPLHYTFRTRFDYLWERNDFTYLPYSEFI